MDTPNLGSVIAFATNAHGAQNRKFRRNDVWLPYITHPLEVMKMVWTWGMGNEFTMSAAVLHDTVEECRVTYYDLLALAGESVARIVMELSLEKGESKDEYLASFKNPSHTTAEALVIKVADRICNVRDYLRDQPAYARKYMVKAAVLGEAITLRNEELVRTWNSEAAWALNQEWNDTLRGVHNAHRS